MTDFSTIIERAAAQPGRIVLPEGDDPRVLQSARSAADAGTAYPILLGDPDTIGSKAKHLQISLDGLTVLDPATSDQRETLATQLIEKRKHKGVTPEQSQTMLDDPLTFGCMMVASGLADGCVAGAVYPTADVVRAGMQFVGKHPDYSFVSSFFIMLTGRSHHPVKGLMLFADCALVIEPDENQLAEIAVVTGESARQLLGMNPEIAMLSFSTAGSAKHDRVTLVANATAKAQALRPKWRIIGDVQLDAAVIPEILSSKAPEMASDKPANILIFPNLDAANIGYKLCERFGDAEAIGPVLQGLAAPVNDLSRGCKTEDIINIIAVTSVQAKNR